MNERNHVLGRFLEFSVHTPDILQSLGFYKLLGFQELKIGEVWSHKYAVVSDGELNIGLHDGKFERPALTFVHQDIARQARSMSKHSFDFHYLKVDPDVFNELGFLDRDKNLIRMIEARTFSPPTWTLTTRCVAAGSKPACRSRTQCAPHNSGHRWHPSCCAYVNSQPYTCASTRPICHWA